LVARAKLSVHEQAGLDKVNARLYRLGSRYFTPDDEYSRGLRLRNELLFDTSRSNTVEDLAANVASLRRSHHPWPGHRGSLLGPWLSQPSSHGYDNQRAARRCSDQAYIQVLRDRGRRERPTAGSSAGQVGRPRAGRFWLARAPDRAPGRPCRRHGSQLRRARPGQSPRTATTGSGCCGRRRLSSKLHPHRRRLRARQAA